MTRQPPPLASLARSTLGAAAAFYSDDALVLHFPIGTTVDQVEQQLLLRTLEVVGGNKQKAARVLGISRRCLYNKLSSYGMAPASVSGDDHDTTGGGAVAVGTERLPADR